MTELRDKAIAFVKQAVEADNAQKYEEAFGLYMHALDFFEAHLKYEKNPRAKEAITKKVSTALGSVCYGNSRLFTRDGTSFFTD